MGRLKLYIIVKSTNSVTSYFSAESFQSKGVCARSRSFQNIKTQLFKNFQYGHKQTRATLF